MKLIVRYSREDKYNNAVFTCNSDIDEKTYNKLIKLGKKLDEKYFDLRSPLYHNIEKNYVNLTTKTNSKLDEGATYQLDIDIMIDPLRSVKAKVNSIKKVKESNYVKLSLDDFEE